MSNGTKPTSSAGEPAGGWPLNPAPKPGSAMREPASCPLACQASKSCPPKSTGSPARLK